MMNFFGDLLTTMRYAVASVLCAIGYTVGLFGQTIALVADLFLDAGDFVVSGPEVDSEDVDDVDTDLEYT